jgi:hypothetical protein
MLIELQLRVLVKVAAHLGKAGVIGEQPVFMHLKSHSASGTSCRHREYSRDFDGDAVWQGPHSDGGSRVAPIFSENLNHKVRKPVHDLGMLLKIGDRVDHTMNRN